MRPDAFRTELTGEPRRLKWRAGCAAFLRREGLLAEPKDEIVRVDPLPGEPSGPARPAEH